MSERGSPADAAARLEDGLRRLGEAFRASQVTMAEAARNYAENMPRLLEALREGGFTCSMGDRDRD